MPGAGTLYSDLKDSPFMDIRGVMAQIKETNNFISIRQLNNASYLSEQERAVFIHHKAFGEAYGFEQSREVLFNAQQVNGDLFTYVSIYYFAITYQQVMIYKKHFLWKSQFDTTINNLHAMGLIRQLLIRNARFLKNIPKPGGGGGGDQQGELVVMQPQHVFTPLILLAIGLVVAIAVFIYESLNGFGGVGRASNSRSSSGSSSSTY